MRDVYLSGVFVEQELLLELLLQCSLSESEIFLSVVVLLCD